MTSLPTGIVAGDSGHISHHNVVHALLNPVDAPFGVTPILVEDFLASRPAAGQAGRLHAARDTGDLDWDDGLIWRSAVATGLTPVADLAARDALTPNPDALVYVLEIDRIHRWSSSQSRWVAMDEVYGINAIDYGFKGIGSSHDDKPSVQAAFNVAFGLGGTGLGPHVVLIPKAPVYGYFSSTFAVGVPMTFRGVGGRGYPTGVTQFARAYATQMRCGSGALFKTTVQTVACLFEYIDAEAGILYKSDTPGTSSGTAQQRFYRCAGHGVLNGTDDTAPIIGADAFWFDINECAFNGASVSTTTTGSVTLSGSPFTVGLQPGVAATLPPGPEYCVIGTPNTAGSRGFQYAGISGNSLTGCTSADTGTFGAGSAITYCGPGIEIRGSDPDVEHEGVSNLIDVRNTIISGNGIRYRQLGPSNGPVLGGYRFNRVDIENGYLGAVSFFNYSGDPVELHGLHMNGVAVIDALLGGSTNYLAALWLDGDDGIAVSQSSIRDCDTGVGEAMVIAYSPGHTVGVEIFDLTGSTTGVKGSSGTSITGLIEHKGGNISLYAGTIAAHSAVTITGNNKIILGSGNLIITTVGGSPEGVVVADPGSKCTDYVNGEDYIKKTGTGNTGWKLITHA